MRAIRVNELGGPEQLVLENLPEPVPGPGEVLVRHAFIGVNFADTGQRSGRSGKAGFKQYDTPVPFTPGNEGSGQVEAVGPGVAGFAPGDRVAYRGAFGSYAEANTVPAADLLHVPDGVPMDVAAGCLTHGMTAHYVSQSCHKVQPGEWILVHAAAGGAGGLTVQMAKMMGATVVGTASTAAKLERARANGCDHVINYATEDFAERCRTLQGFEGFHAVFDCVSRTTFEKGLELLRPTGDMVIFGMSSGAIPPFDIQRLNPMGSLSVRRTKMNDFVRTREALESRANDVFRWIADGKLRIRIDRTLALEDARQAHEALEGRATMGKVLLQP
jgi:NADPH2:quinone reductase